MKIKKTKPTVMFIEWMTHGREFDMQIPIIFFFEKILKWNVLYKSQFNLPSIIEFVPDIIIISGDGGSHIGLEWSRKIEKSNIPLFTQVTEGIFKEIDIEEFVWGHGKKEKHISSKLVMQWSLNSYLMTKKYFPKIEPKIKVSGAVGFDKYKLLMKQNHKNFKETRVIGYGGFDFNSIIEKPQFKKYRETFIKDAQKCYLILKELALFFPDITFLIKPHPGDLGSVPLEVKELQNFKNIKIDFDIEIQDAIKSVNIWLNYNSSTNIDAWLMEKPSISFLTNKKRSSPTLMGSVRENDIKKIKEMIIEYYENGNIKRFDELRGKRETIIKDTIGYPDGMNHVRFMSFLKPYIEGIENGRIQKGRWKLTPKEKIIGYIKHYVYSFSNGRPWIPFFGRYSEKYKLFSLEHYHSQKHCAFHQIELFYQENSIKINKLYNGFAENFNVGLYKNKKN